MAIVDDDFGVQSGSISYLNVSQESNNLLISLGFEAEFLMNINGS